MLEKEKKSSRKKSSPRKAAAGDPIPQAQTLPGGSPHLAAAQEAVRRTAEAEPGRSAAITHEERRRMIAEAAYFRAQRRGFAGGNQVRDWIEAEAEIDALLLRR